MLFHWRQRWTFTVEGNRITGGSFSNAPKVVSSTPVKLTYICCCCCCCSLLMWHCNINLPPLHPKPWHVCCCCCCCAQDDSDDDIDDDSGGDSEHRSADSQSVDSRSTVGAQENRTSQPLLRSAAVTAASSTLPVTSRSSGGGRRSRRRPVSEEWEILEGLKSGQQFELAVPQKYGGYIMKSRKWPMKGWHKVMFMSSFLLRNSNERLNQDLIIKVRNELNLLKERYFSPRDEFIYIINALVLKTIT